MTRSSTLCICLLLLSLAHPAAAANTSAPASGPSPKSLHSSAISLAKSGRLQESLQYFRAAVRADPANYEYLNNLGVTEMRVGSFRKAAYRFFLALQLSDGHYETAWDNLRDLRQFLDEDKSEYERYYKEWLGRSDRNKPIEGGPDVEYGQRHTTRALPVIDYETFFDPGNETAQRCVVADAWWGACTTTSQKTKNSSLSLSLSPSPRPASSWATSPTSSPTP